MREDKYNTERIELGMGDHKSCREARQSMNGYKNKL